MVQGKIKAAILAAMAVAMAAGSAHAGGLERGGYNIDLLFDPSTYAAEAAATYVNPQRELNDVTDTNIANGLGSNGIGGGKTDGVRDSETYWVPRIGVKAGIGDSVDCMADYSQPWGAHTHPGTDWAGANENIETKVESDNYAATCSYKWDVGQGQFRVIGGGFYQEVSGFKDRLVVGGLPAALGSGVGHLELDSHGWGWRAGVAYEITEYALRASLVYNSEVDLGDITGTLDLTQVPGLIAPGNPLLGVKTSVFGDASMPDSLELKVQSGFAPDWLAFGSVKWTDWSQLQSIAFCPVSTKGLASCQTGGPTQATSLDLLYRDGWTVSGGVGHKFNDQWSGAISVTWDRGTSTGIGTQSDTWTLGTGVSYAPTSNVELRLAGAIGYLTDGKSRSKTVDGITYGNDVSYSFDNDLVTAISTSLKVKF